MRKTGSKKSQAIAPQAMEAGPIPPKPVIANDIADAFAAWSYYGSTSNSIKRFSLLFCVTISVLLNNVFMNRELFEDDFGWSVKWVWFTISILGIASVISSIVTRFKGSAKHEAGLFVRGEFFPAEKEVTKTLRHNGKTLGLYGSTYQKKLCIAEDMLETLEGVRKIRATQLDVIRKFIVPVCGIRPYGGDVASILDNSALTLITEERLKALIANDKEADGILGENRSPIVILTEGLSRGNFPQQKKFYADGRVTIIWRDNDRWDFIRFPSFREIITVVPRQLFNLSFFSLMRAGPFIAMFFSINKATHSLLERAGLYKHIPFQARLLPYVLIWSLSILRSVVNDNNKSIRGEDTLRAWAHQWRYSLGFGTKLGLGLATSAALLLLALIYLQANIAPAWFFTESGIEVTEQQILDVLEIFTVKDWFQDNIPINPEYLQIFYQAMTYLNVAGVAVSTVLTGIHPMWNRVYKFFARIPAPADDFTQSSFAAKVKAASLIATAIDTGGYAINNGWWAVKQMVKSGKLDWFFGMFNFLGSGVSESIKSNYHYATFASILLLFGKWNHLLAAEGWPGVVKLFRKSENDKTLADFDGIPKAKLSISQSEPNLRVLDRAQPAPSVRVEEIPLGDSGRTGESSVNQGDGRSVASAGSQVAQSNNRVAFFQGPAPAAMGGAQQPAVPASNAPGFSLVRSQ